MNQLLVKRTEVEGPRWQIQIQIQASIETQGMEGLFDVLNE